MKTGQRVGPQGILETGRAVLGDRRHFRAIWLLGEMLMVLIVRRQGAGSRPWRGDLRHVFFANEAIRQCDGRPAARIARQGCVGGFDGVDGVDGVEAGQALRWLRTRRWLDARRMH